MRLLNPFAFWKNTKTTFKQAKSKPIDPVMTQYILTFNAGSSSIKFAQFVFATSNTSSLHLVHKGQVENIGRDGLTHAQALAQIVRNLDVSNVVAIGHRIVHGGTSFATPVLIDSQVIDAMAALSPLAPLHQPHNIAGVRAAIAAFPNAKQVACFDTAFHRTMPAINQCFAIPQALHDEGIQRYGFHGLSYESIRAQMREHSPDLANQKIVVAHLGNGASLCAMNGGRSIATTMSFSPLDGLPMGTRSGRIDAAVVLYLIEQKGMSAAQVSHLLYKESGLLGLSGVSSDMRQLHASKNPNAEAAICYFVAHIQREIAAMTAALHGLDGIVFTGGIGQNDSLIRARVLDGLRWMGIKLNAQANTAHETCITEKSSITPAFVLPTDEEAVIAQHTKALAC